MGNVIDVEAESLVATALSSSLPCGLFTDVGTAFPSLFIGCLIAVLATIGCPRWFVGWVYYAYSNGFGIIRLAGETFGRFPMQGGVRLG